MPGLSRRSFLAVGAAVAAAPSFTPPRPRRAAASSTLRDLAWTDVVAWPIEGRAFADRRSPYDRLPARAEGVVRAPVWDLSRHSAGMVVRFRTASPELHVRYRLTLDRIAMPHMPATGVSGVDLYGRDGDRWRWIEVTRPQGRDVEARLFRGAAAAAGAEGDGARAFQLYLPLYNGVETLELGVPAGAAIEPLPARGEGGKAIVCYGTSILHGACASRPGMAWPAIVGRALDREVVNLGFSGNGRMEAEVGRFLAELEPAVFVVDCLPNMSAGQVAERTGPLVRQLREARPATPILLVEDRTFADAWFDPGRMAAHRERRAALRAAFAALQKDGVEGLSLLAGETLLGDDDDGTTDGSHPNDLGMMRQADAVLAALRPLLGG